MKEYAHIYIHEILEENSILINEIMDDLDVRVTKLVSIPGPLKLQYWKIRMEDRVTDKEETKRHAWSVGRFFGCAQPKSTELRRWVETADEPCTWPQFVLSIYTSWNVPATFARQTARCSISNTLRKRWARSANRGCLPYNYHLHRENIYIHIYTHTYINIYI